MNNKVLFSSDKDEWETPQDFFDKLNEEFHFTIDIAASPLNKKCKRFYSPADDALKQNWNNEIVWCNPPYGRKVYDWVRKSSLTKNATVVILLPARTDTKWFHEFCYHNKNCEIRFLQGRLKFGKSKTAAPFPSVLIIFRNYN